MKIFRRKVIFCAVIAVFLIGIIGGGVYLKSVMDYKRAVRETSFAEIDISEIPDGTYIGEYDVDFIYARVEVTVQNGKITDINILEHRQERGKMRRLSWTR